ncbi:hypothetical protein [Halopseudomonas salegens]|uniref:Uncharacterized protein n=1 Tax=Halopseudomonas salegens TaxID=1434072 RepID=A0A1H2ERQ7_9GAMM|nr:hypothetical protein [Halopseudomonas salegens]SDT97418.1 hypothetical protein SAMN05216210_0954 [Halopseudomonas salegens]
MFEFTVFVGLIALFLALKPDEAFELQPLCAIAMMAVYLTIYLYVPPVLTIKVRYVGLAFGYVPTVAVVAILFPELNSSQPIAVTRFLGWLGLMMIFLLMCLLKLFVW